MRRRKTTLELTETEARALHLLLGHSYVQNVNRVLPDRRRTMPALARLLRRVERLIIDRADDRAQR